MSQAAPSSPMPTFDLNQRSPWALEATVFDAPGPFDLRVREHALICVDAQGTITEVIEQSDLRWALERQRYADTQQLRVLPQGQYLMPGMVDLHVHAPQWPQSGKALDVPLEGWLQDNTFPLEARFADAQYAHRIYDHLVPTLLANGTTTVLYFGGVHNAGNEVLAERCMHYGQRALVGKVAMDLADQCPAYYMDASAQEAIDQTKALMDWIYQHPANARQTVLPVITPRFIPTCSDELLQGLGALAQSTGAHVQSHCSESDWAHQHVLERMGCTDAHALHRFGLITRRTVLAHAPFLTPEDVALLAREGASIAHCPLSNFYFANSVFPAREQQAVRLGMGLGTDISGGYSPSMLDACRHAVTASLALHEGTDPELLSADRGRKGQGRTAQIDHVFALWLATTAGGQVLDLPVGRIEAGYAMDALAMDCSATHSNVAVWPEDSAADVLQKLLYNATRANVAKVWVQGQQVHSSAAH